MQGVTSVLLLEAEIKNQRQIVHFYTLPLKQQMVLHRSCLRATVRSFDCMGMMTEMVISGIVLAPVEEAWPSGPPSFTSEHHWTCGETNDKV